MNNSLDHAFSDLEQSGLKWMAVVSANKGPEKDRKIVQAIHPDACVILFMSVGSDFYEKLPAEQHRSTDPIDDASKNRTLQFVETYLKPEGTRLLYPQAADVDLRAWMVAAHVGEPSLLGVTIHPDYGTWYAVRSMVAAKLPAEIVACIQNRYPSINAKSPVCHTCIDKPCIEACPARAVTPDESFSLNRCMNHRASADSPCAAQCLARNACPVGREYRYGEQQMAYHYGRSLATINEWLERQSH